MRFSSRLSSGLSRRFVSSPLVLGAALAAVMSAGTARAEIPGTSGPAVGVGMICNTSAQASRFVDLRAKGTAARQAMDTVNKEMHDPHACGLAAIAFLRDATVDSKPVADRLVQVVRINVVAGFDGNGWQRVSGMIQYAVTEGEGETI